MAFVPFFTNGVPAAESPLTGAERIPCDASEQSESLTAEQIALYTQTLLLSNGLYSADADTASFTADAGQVAGARLVVLDLNGVLGGDSILTMPSAQALAGAIPNVFGGESWVLRVLNSSSAAHKWTVAGNSSVALSGTADVGQNTWREYLLTLNNTLTTATMQNIGAGDT